MLDLNKSCKAIVFDFKSIFYRICVIFKIIEHIEFPLLVEHIVL